MDNLINNTNTKNTDKKIIISDVRVSFTRQQIGKVAEMLKQISKDAFIAGGGTEVEYKKWWIPGRVDLSIIGLRSENNRK